MKQYSKFNIIAYNIFHVKGIIENVVKDYKGFYAYIKHKAELPNEKDHYHIVIVLNKGQRITFNKLVKYANCYNELINIDDINKVFTINLIEVCSNVPLSIQYLIHVNDEDKYQYDREEIISNDYDYLNNNLSATISYNSIKDNSNYVLNSLYDYIYNGIITNKMEVLSFLRNSNNLNLYSRNRYLINDLLDYQRINDKEK